MGLINTIITTLRFRSPLQLVEIEDNEGTLQLWLYVENKDLDALDKYLEKGGCRFGTETDYTEFREDLLPLYRRKEV